MKKVKTNRPRTPEYDRALELARESQSEPQPLCIDDYSFVDYSTPPSKEEAEEKCRDENGVDCPLKALCKASAREERPAWGVRGGVAWDMGRQAHWVKALREAREGAEKNVA